MAIGDFIYRLKPQSGDAEPHNELNGAQTISGGTISLVDTGGGLYAWRFSGSDSTGTTDAYAKTMSGSGLGGGATMAIRMRRQTGSTTRHRMLSWSPTTTADASGSQSIRFNLGTDDLDVYGNGTGGFLTLANSYDGTIRTYVVRVSSNSSSSFDITHLWWTGGGGTSTPDVASSGFNGADASLDTIVIQCGDGTVDIVDAVLWGEELSDSDCASIVADIDSALGGGGGSAIAAISNYYRMMRSA